MAIKEENSIGYRIVAAFGAKDLKEVAQTLGENYSSLHNWATQRRDFPTNVLIKIARMTNQSIDWILTGENARAEGLTEGQNLEQMIEAKIRAVVRDEMENSAALHEKIQGIVMAMKPSINEQNAFEMNDQEERAA